MYILVVSDGDELDPSEDAHCKDSNRDRDSTLRNPQHEPTSSFEHGCKRRQEDVLRCRTAYHKTCQWLGIHEGLIIALTNARP